MQGNTQTVLGLAIITDGPRPRQRRWLLEDGTWSQRGPQTQVDWPPGVKVFDDWAAADAYARTHLPIEPGAYGTYGFELILA